MKIDHLLPQRGTLATVTDGPPDDYNVPTEVTTTTEVACWIATHKGSEDTADTNQQTAQVTIYLPAGTTATGRDHITIDGATYQFDGPPWAATNPLAGGTVAYLQATAKRVT